MAVTYYNQTVLGGTSNPRYADPLVTGAPNADGLYPWSTFRARFATYSNGVVDASIDLPGGQTSGAGPVNLLLFTSDVPAAGYIAPTATAAAVRPVAPVVQVGTAGNPAFFKKEASSSANVTVAAGQVAAGYVSTQAAAPNAYISATGFPAGVATPAADVTSAELWLWANSPNVASPISLQNWDTVAAGTAVASGALPIVLRYSDYTQAVRDAGNIIVNTAAPIGATYQVVGLYSIGAS